MSDNGEHVDGVVTSAEQSVSVAAEPAPPKGPTRIGIPDKGRFLMYLGAALLVFGNLAAIMNYMASKGAFTPDPSIFDKAKSAAAQKAAAKPGPTTAAAKTQTPALPEPKPDVYPADVSLDLKPFRVVNAHEHLYKTTYFEQRYMEPAKKLGVVKTLLVASSEFTFVGKEKTPKDGNEANSEEILAASRKYPDLIVPMFTLHPEDADKIEKIKKYVAEGGKGLKLYNGHSSFHGSKPLDDPEMMPVFQYCADTGLPICWHVNFVKFKDEFLRVMEAFPNLKVIVPHFGVAFFEPMNPPLAALGEALDKYPNLYTDTSFGTRQIMVKGLEAVSEYPQVFTEFILKHSDKIMFGTDFVITGNSEKTSQWVEATIRAARDMLEKDRFYFFLAAPGSKSATPAKMNQHKGYFKGLNLSDDILKKIYETNFYKLFPETAPAGQ